MAVNKVVINDAVVLDLTGDTVRAADLPKGVIAHSATGAKVTGTTNYAGSSNAGGSATSAEKLNNKPDHQTERNQSGRMGRQQRKNH